MKRQPAATRAASAFTLIEIMLAIGVLGVGMIMVGTIFPAAIQQTQRADQMTKATMICDNARSIITMNLRHSAADGVGPVFVELPMGNQETGGAHMVYDTDAWYPQPKRTDFGESDWPLNSADRDHLYEAHTHGWVALVRQVAGSGNDYQFVVIPYAKFPGVDYTGPSEDDSGDWAHEYDNDTSAHRPALVRIASTGGFSGTEDVTVYQDEHECRVYFSGDAKQFAAIGSPVILDGRAGADRSVLGRFPTIVGLYEDGNQLVARLSGMLFEDVAPGDSPRTEQRGIWVMPGVAEGARSPAIGGAAFRVRLKR